MFWLAFLLNVNWPQYQILIGCTFVEYFIEKLLFPSMKGNSLLVFIGLLVVIAGQTLRSRMSHLINCWSENLTSSRLVAQWTAGQNFHHYVREEREKDHQLVTHGIYS